MMRGGNCVARVDALCKEQYKLVRPPQRVWLRLFVVRAT